MSCVGYLQFSDRMEKTESSQDGYFKTPLYAPCPFATWTVWCPHATNPAECLKCPARKIALKEK